ncbi:MAG: WbqC family protein [Candidatus Scalindua sp.]|jgi:hypothetical protein|nr:WbqC family protein [Candidatus Scalindua sp.]
MHLTIHQPEHLPWLGFFEKVSQAEVLVLLDTVQYRHKYFQNRNKIRSSNGTTWLNVPVLRKGNKQSPINEMEINNNALRWREKCWGSILLNYNKAVFFKKYSEFFKNAYERNWNLLSDLNIFLLRHIIHSLNVKIKILKSSELRVAGVGEKLVLDICKEVGADVYISGISGIGGQGRSFESEFLKEGIKVVYQEFYHPIYKQQFEPFIPCMSIIDLLFNYGDKSLDVIKGIGVDKIDKFFE